MCVTFDLTKAGSGTLVSLILLVCLETINVQGQNNLPNVTSNDSVRRKTCLLKPDTGPCRANILMHYFDPKSGTCKKFVWGGCQGNGNRFNSPEECYNDCFRNAAANPKVRPRYCNLSFDYGYCFGAIPRYYYDPLWKVCKERLYSGCGGNKNNFYNVEQCDSICRYGTGFIKSAKLKKGQIRKVIIINPHVGKTTTVDSHLQTAKGSAPKAANDQT